MTKNPIINCHFPNIPMPISKIIALDELFTDELKLYIKFQTIKIIPSTNRDRSNFVVVAK
jgi:hypothetical protein